MSRFGVNATQLIDEFDKNTFDNPWKSKEFESLQTPDVDFLFSLGTRFCSQILKFGCKFLF